MAITCTLIDSINNASDLSSYSFTSKTYSNNKLYIVFVGTSHGTLLAPAPSAISGGGLTFTNVGTDVSYSSVGVRAISCWRALVTSGATTGTVTITLTGNTPSTSCEAVILELDGIDTSGTNGSGAIVQSGTTSGSSTTLTVTLSAFGSADNRPVGFFTWRANSTGTVGSGFSLLTTNNHASPSMGFLAEWHSTSNDNTVDASWASAQCGAYALEIKAASSTPTSFPPTTQPSLLYPSFFSR